MAPDPGWLSDVTKGIVNAVSLVGIWVHSSLQSGTNQPKG